MIQLRFVQFAAISLGILILVVSTSSGYAQTYGGNVDDYYIFEYYLNNPPPLPPQQTKDETVRTVITQGGANRIASSFRKVTKVANVAKAATSTRGTVFRPRVEAGAGDWLDNFSMSLDYSLAQVDDDTLQGSGHDTDGSLLTSASIGDSFAAGLGLSHNRYTIGGVGDYEQNTTAADLFCNWFVSDFWVLGMFVNHSQVDIEDDFRFNTSTLSFENVADSFNRWGAGMLASFNIPLTSSTNMGITNTLTSMNKSSLARVFDDEDAAWLCVFDVDQGITDDLSVGAYTTFYYLIDREKGTPDGSYAMLGLDVTYRLFSWGSLSAGVDTTMGDNDRDEIRMNLGLTYEF